MIKKYFFSLLLFSILVAGCSPKSQKTISGIQYTDSVPLKYADGFAIYSNDDFKLVVVYNPWVKGEVYARYYLVNDESVEVPSDGAKIIVPLKSIASASTTHYEFLSLLDKINTVTGVCLPDYVYNEQLREQIAKGSVTDLGDALKINVEETLRLQPSALMVSGYNQNDANVLRIDQAGIPVLFNNEWTEKSLLARAEWVKFVAAFYDKEDLADEIFGSIDSTYNDIKAKVQNVAQKQTVMAGSNFRGTWYMPSGDSFMAKLFADAGASYYYANDTTSGSLPLNVETVLKNFADADVWLNCNYNSMTELKDTDRKNMLFKAAQNNKVYSFNKRMSESGANDFWESAIARPDLLLSDVIAILHPEILPNYKLYYAEKLE